MTQRTAVTVRPAGGVDVQLWVRTVDEHQQLGEPMLITLSANSTLHVNFNIVDELEIQELANSSLERTAAAILKMREQP